MKVVFSGGQIFVADAARRSVPAIGVVDDLIVVAGSEGEVREAIGSGYEHIDLNGRFMLPGFQDAHVHPVMGGLTKARCDLEGLEDADQALGVIGRYASANDSEWVLGGGWKYPWFVGGNPAASALDSVTQGPAYLVVADGHSGWANTEALKRAGITAATLDPDDGIIVRLPDGSPQGTLHEGAMRLVESVLPRDGPDEVVAGLLAAQSYLHSLGITAWQDAWVTPQIHDAYRTIAADGRLTASVRSALWWDRERGIEQLEEHVQRSREGVGRYDPTTVKLMLDGVCENHTAALLGSYLDGHGEPTGNAGLDFIEPAELDIIVPAIDAAGLQCHFHALGDRAVRNALDAIEAARNRNGWKDTRPHLAHLQIVDPADIPRFRRLGATVNAQPLWAVSEPAMTELTIPYIGPERTERQYPWRSLLDAGATIAMGSDWPVSTPNVMKQVSVAVTRTAPHEVPEEPFLPEQRLRLVDALVGFTAGSAYVNRLDSVAGTIAAGMRADLVLLSANPFEADSIGAIDVDLTMAGGDIVFDRELAS